MADAIDRLSKLEAGEPILRVQDLTKEYVTRRRRVHAVSGVSFDLMRTETLGLVGELGCGKSTVGRSILQLPPPTSGRVLFEGQDLCVLKGETLRAIRPRLQMVFQDPISSLNPRRTIAEIVKAPLAVNSTAAPTAREILVRDMLEAVGLDARAVWNSAAARIVRGAVPASKSCTRAGIATPRSRL